MTRRQKWAGRLWFAGIVTALVVNISLAFLLTNWLYGLIGWSPPLVAIQVVNALLGLTLTVLAIWLVVHVFSPRFAEEQRRVYQPIIEALERIAKGDFSVRVDDTLFEERGQSRGVLGNLVGTVNQMALELDQMETMRQEFISNVSHEIQSPLTSIRGFAQALQNEHLSADERQHYLNIIETESTRISKLADDLLKLASLEADQVKFEPKRYRLDRQIRHLILTCEPQWTAKAIDLNITLEEASICADEDLLSQVWVNLLNNAIKFTPQGGTIRVELHRRDDHIEFIIADSGIGISEADQARIFERFYKADKSRRRSTEGSGLGLAIARTIIDLHHGTIAVNSAADTGTTFTITLPDDATKVEPAAALTQQVD